MSSVYWFNPFKKLKDIDGFYENINMSVNNGLLIKLFNKYQLANLYMVYWYKILIINKILFLYYPCFLNGGVYG